MTVGIETHHSRPPCTSHAPANSSPASVYIAGLRSRGEMNVIMLLTPSDAILNWQAG